MDNNVHNDISGPLADIAELEAFLNADGTPTCRNGYHRISRYDKHCAHCGKYFEPHWVDVTTVSDAAQGFLRWYDPKKEGPSQQRKCEHTFVAQSGFVAWICRKCGAKM